MNHKKLDFIHSPFSIKKGYYTNALKPTISPTIQGFPGGSDGKESACNVGDLGSIPGSGRAPEKENFAWKIPWVEDPGRL